MPSRAWACSSRRSDMARSGGRRRDAHPVPARHHRRELGVGGASLVPTGRPARRRLHRRAATCATCRSRCLSSVAASSASRWPPYTRASVPIVTVVELADRLMPGADLDLVKPLQCRKASATRASTSRRRSSRRVPRRRASMSPSTARPAPRPQIYDRVLVAVGRSPNGKQIGADKAGVTVTDRGFIPVDHQMRTNVLHIFAIGDIVGQPMLAHKATHEAKCRGRSRRRPQELLRCRVIPSVAYTDPEVAWVGITEGQAKVGGPEARQGRLPVGRVRPRPRRRPRRGLHQAPVRGGQPPHPRRRHRGPARGRSDGRGRPRHRDGRRCRRHRPDHPPASDALGEYWHGGRGVRGHPHRPLHRPKKK